MEYFVKYELVYADNSRNNFQTGFSIKTENPDFESVKRWAESQLRGIQNDHIREIRNAVIIPPDGKNVKLSLEETLA